MDDSRRPEAHQRIAESFQKRLRASRRCRLIQAALSWPPRDGEIFALGVQWVDSLAAGGEDAPDPGRREP